MAGSERFVTYRGADLPVIPYRVKYGPTFVSRDIYIPDAYRAGASIRAIAKHMEISQRQVLKVLDRNGVKRRHRKIAKPQRIVLLLERSALARIRKKAGRGKVNEWIRKVIDEALG